MARDAENDFEVEIAEPLGHGDIVRGLWRAARAERLPHALLFHGPAGVGKFRSALWLATGLLCARGVDPERGPCGQCGPCKRARSGNHPDLCVVDVRQEDPKERSEELRIGRFVPREQDYWPGPSIEDFLGLKAAEGGWRVIVVREMERANEEAQNSSLKMLEEPAARVLWMLECSSTDDLLPTIRSRCIPIAFGALERSAVHELLLARGVPREIAAPLARWSRGSPGEALRAFAQHAWEARAVLLEVLAGRATPWTAGAALWQLEGEFDGKTPKAVERARLRAALDLALAVVGDVARARAGASESELAHGDVVAAARDWPALRSEPALERALDALLATRRDVEANVDPPALLDRALLALAPPPAAAARTARGAAAR